MNWVGDWAGRRRALTPARTALVDPARDRAVSYAELDERACRWASWMVDVAGLAAGDVIALVSRNQLEAVEVFMAAGKVGVVLAPLSHRLAPAEAAELLRRLEPAWLVFDEGLGDFVAALEEAATALPTLAFGSPSSGAERALAALEARPVNRALALAETALLVHTGGSTGLPKICRVSHRQMVWNAVELLVAAADGLAGRRELLLFPLYHIGGWNTLLPILYAGGCVVMPGDFDATATLRAIERYRINHFGAVEAMLQAMAAAPEFATTALDSVEAITSAGAPCSEVSMAPFLARGIDVRQAYGLTEAGPSNFINADPGAGNDSGARASVGRAFFHCDHRIVDPVSGRAVATNEPGELQLRSPHDFDGYLDDPAATRARWSEDGWIRSGDLAREDANGRVFIIGRADNVIVSGGENIAAEELEAVLRGHPAVTAALVFGVPDARWGERPVAWLTGPGEDGLADVRAWLEARLARFKHPVRLTAVDALPMTGAGKPDRRAAQRQTIEAERGEES